MTVVMTPEEFISTCGIAFNEWAEENVMPVFTTVYTPLGLRIHAHFPDEHRATLFKLRWM